jgi:DHA1 family multidrug resistance protein-like MFS transporter
MAQHLDLTPTLTPSFTIVDHEYDHHRDGGHDRAKPIHKSPLEQEMSKDEERFEMYGGDDPHDPDFARSTSAKGVSPDIVDTNLVTWDGSNDPENPQKWSRSYKWMVTILCAIMTLNVYARHLVAYDRVLIFQILSTFASSAPTVAYSAIRDQFDVPYEVTYLITTVFFLGYVFGPIF